MLTHAIRRTRRALIALSIGAMPLAAMAQQASSPTTSDPQTGAPAMQKSTHKTHVKKMSPNSTGGASNSANVLGKSNGAGANDTGGAATPGNGAAGGN
jgi:hypothetical protein